MRILITGGAGYIGSTIGSAALDAGHEVVVVDDLSEGRAEFCSDRVFIKGDIGDKALMGRVFDENRIDAVIHCAAHIVVPESVSQPLRYYENNVGKTLDLIEVMLDHGVHDIVFSSSASVYSDPQEGFAVTETDPVSADCPYAYTKLMMEQVLKDVSEASALRPVILRYFNPLGADPSLRSGQQRPHPTNVLGKMMDAWAEDGTFTITGCDWDTPDGTGIRDYIHVWDLAQAHVAALERLSELVDEEHPWQVINIGTGRPMSVRELVGAFEEATGRPLRTAEGPARPGDVIGAYARTDKAAELLGWHARLSVAEGIRDALAWLPRRREMLGY